MLISSMQKIPKKSNGSVRSEVIHIESDRTLLFHFQTGSLPSFSSVEIKMVRAVPLGWPTLFGNCCSIFPRVVPSGYSLTGQSGIMKATSHSPWGHLNYRDSNLLGNNSYLYIETCSTTQLSQHINNMFSISMTTNYFIHELNPRVS